jgi:serine/threonine protein kinase
MEQQLQLGHQIGKGGFGTVYRGQLVSPSGLKQQVAVKILGEVDPRSQALQRLRDEGRILATLQHASILRVHDLVLIEGRVALVTEYVPGADLSKAVKWDGPKPGVRVALEVCGHVAEALHAAHNASVDGQRLDLVHRDVKPANIRITPHGTIKLLDFGIAKTRAPDREAKTEVNIMLGSMRYLAPEVVAFDVANGGPPADICALGYTLFEAMAHEPFQSGLSHRQQQAIALSRRKYSAWLTQRWAALPEEAPRAVFGLLHAMLDRDPAKRPGALEVADRCFEIAESLPDSLRTWTRHVDWTQADYSKPGPMTGQTVDLQVLTDERQRSPAEVAEALAPPKAKPMPPRYLAPPPLPSNLTEAPTELMADGALPELREEEGTIWGSSAAEAGVAPEPELAATELAAELDALQLRPGSLAARMAAQHGDTLSQLESPIPADHPVGKPLHREPATQRPRPALRTVLPETPVAETSTGRALLEQARPPAPAEAPRARPAPSSKTNELVMLAIAMAFAAVAGAAFYVVALAPDTQPVVHAMDVPSE